MVDLLPVRDAQERILAHFTANRREPVGLAAGYNRVLAEEILAPHDLPPFDNASMDGYAVRSIDLSCAAPPTPVDLRLVADIPAGTVWPHTLNAGETARIMTGAPLPDGADAVVPLEEITLLDGSVRFTNPVVPGSSVRPRGMDLRAGQTILSAGRSLRPQDIGILAALGFDAFIAFSRPRAALFSSGDELVQPGRPLEPGKIYDSNAFVLSGLLQAEGAEVQMLGTARDDPADIERLLDQAIDQNSDLIVTSGGVSVGAFDFVRDVILKHGALHFWRVNMRPGKPLAFGNYKGIPLIGLPGNPVSAFVGCAVFVLPVIRKLSGLPPLARPVLTVTLLEDIESDGRESYLRARVVKDGSRWVAGLPTHQGSGNLFSLVQSNALLILPIGVKSLPAGSQATAWILADHLNNEAG